MSQAAFTGQQQPAYSRKHLFKAGLKIKVETANEIVLQLFKVSLFQIWRAVGELNNREIPYEI